MLRKFRKLEFFKAVSMFTAGFGRCRSQWVKVRKIKVKVSVQQSGKSAMHSEIGRDDLIEGSHFAGHHVCSVLWVVYISFFIHFSALNANFLHSFWKWRDLHLFLKEAEDKNWLFLIENIDHGRLLWDRFLNTNKNIKNRSNSRSTSKIYLMIVSAFIKRERRRVCLHFNVHLLI